MMYTRHIRSGRAAELYKAHLQSARPAARSQEVQLQEDILQAVACARARGCPARRSIPACLRAGVSGPQENHCNCAAEENCRILHTQQSLQLKKKGSAGPRQLISSPHS